MCISRAILHWYLRETSKLHYFSKGQHKYEIEHCMRIVESATDIEVGERVVPLDPFSLVEVDTYKRKASSQSNVLVDLEETNV